MSEIQTKISETVFYLYKAVKASWEVECLMSKSQHLFVRISVIYYKGKGGTIRVHEGDGARGT